MSHPVATIHSAPDALGRERIITRGPGGRILTNTGVWSPDGQWIVYDTRSDAAGDGFDGQRIEMVNVNDGRVRVLYESTRGAHCGVATFHPREPKVIFILGPENPTPDWTYNAWHRQGVIVEVATGDGSTETKSAPVVHRLDARDVVAPFTPGALRGGSHVHVWDAAGEWVSFTYEDHVLASLPPGAGEPNRRNIGVAVPGHPVSPRSAHPRNHDGEYFSVLVTRTTAAPRPGSDEISRAFEEGWIGTNGYVRTDGSRQRRALAFLGLVMNSSGTTNSEVFVVDLPDDVTRVGAGPLEGTATRLPAPPAGVRQRRLTHLAGRKFPGVQGPRHWLRSAPDGSAIAFLACDDAGVVQLWTVSPLGGEPRQITHNAQGIASAFSWSPDGRRIAHVMDGSICTTDVAAGETRRWTPTTEGAGPRPEACVFSPDGRKIAFVRRSRGLDGEVNQICVVTVIGD